MCGIVGAVTARNAVPSLLEGLKRLEYRGYDSAGIAVVDIKGQLQRRRVSGKVNVLENLLQVQPLTGSIGISHTRWATHGKPSECNAHPQFAEDEIALVHNGIIENHQQLRARLLAQGCPIESETDSELVAHLVNLNLKSGQDFLTAVRTTANDLEGAYAIGFIRKGEPEHLLAIRCGSPLVIGLGQDENFIASDPMALLPFAQRFIYLEDGDIADIQRNKVTIYASTGAVIHRPIHQSNLKMEPNTKGHYRHFMQKEIFEQPNAVLSTLDGRIANQSVIVETFGANAAEIFARVRRIQIVACGTSYHAGLVGKYWLEAIAGIPCQVEIASENRYRKQMIEPDTLFVVLSQSGETADALAAFRQAKQNGYLAALTICNVPDSSLVRESDLVIMTAAGPEIGVASTKAFTTQLAALLLLTLVLGRNRGLGKDEEAGLVKRLETIPTLLAQTLKMDTDIKLLASELRDKTNALFLGRGLQLPIAMEGALKLKEISYIHAEAYPAGELKHGPLALVDSQMPVIILAPVDELFEKVKSNIQEVLARDGEDYHFYQ